MVKINTSKRDEDVIDLRGSSRKENEVMDDEPEFKISQMADDDFDTRIDAGEMPVKASPVHETDMSEMRTTEKVRVKFDKFAALVAGHASQELLDKCRDEDVIVSTNLLTDLANTGGGSDSKKVPAMFMVGIILGIILTWILLKS